MLNFCANNYLGLANNPEVFLLIINQNTKVIEASKRMMDMRGQGMASVRFICGTQVLYLHYIFKN